jgi:xylulokinase
VPERTIGAAYGDALLAAIGAGLTAPDTDWSRTATIVEPDPENAAVYDRLYDAYTELYPATAGIVHRLGSLEAGAWREPQPAQR